MKRVVFLALGAALFANVAFAQKVACTQKILAAVESERAAVARYEAAAVKADAEGYKGAASLFRAAAKAESIHAGRFAGLLKTRGIENEAPAIAPPAVGSTAENVSAAAVAEQAERDSTYREAVAACQKSDPDAAEVFDTTRDAEVEHLNLFADAARHLDMFKDAKTFYVCSVCGYTTNVKLPLCPSCREKHAMAPVD
jgi:rubrerythrin